jgi:murein tripeptide amidase MpaA
MTIAISSAFDSGSIEILAVDGNQADLAIRHDLAADGTRSEFLQWFHFRVSGAERGGARLRIVNAGQTTYAGGWRDYRAVASWDRRRWERIATAFDGEVMTIELPPAPGPSYVAYFEPYSWERHLALLADSCARGAAPRRRGASVQGRDLDALVVGDGAPPVWIIGRQHPGETMAEWFIDGLLARLLDEADPIGRALRRQATFHIVPNMNPDGSVLGNLRTNAAGANLNREWLEPALKRSPEVTAVRDAIHSTGCAAFFDIHGDENLPYVFVAGCEMLPNFSERQRAEQDRFSADFTGASPDFQTAHGYSPGKYKDDVLKLASKYIGHTFGCLSLTLEMPFKDNANAPDPRFGWSAARSQRLGAAMLDPVWRHLQRT